MVGTHPAPGQAKRSGPQPEAHEERLSRRSALALLASAVGTAWVAACVPNPPGAPAAVTKPTPAAAGAVGGTASKPAGGQPRTGGTLRVGVPSDIVTLDGIVRGGQPYESAWLIYDRLVTYDDTLKPLPMLAESWDVTPDYKQIKMNLRKNVTWHSGREFTSDDVKWNFVRVRDPKAGFGDFALQSSWFTTVETPDKYTVILTSEQSRPSMFDFFQQFNLNDPVTMEGPDARTKAIGTGPFTFVEWAQGEHITIAKNKNYWQTGKPYLDGIVARIMPDLPAGIAAVEAGAVDLLRTESFRDVARLKQDPNYQVFLHPNAGRYFELAFKYTAAPFDNKLVRQAFNWAIDRQRLVDTFAGFAQPLNLQWTPSSPAYDASKNQTYSLNLDKARSLLQQAGVGDFETEVWVQTAVPLNSLGFLQIYQADLAKIGVKLNISTADPAAWTAGVLSRTYKAIYATGDVLGNLHPISNLNGPTWRPKPNNTDWETPEWTDIWTQVSTEVDPARQKPLFARLNDYILDQCFAIPVCTGPQILLGSSKVKGLEPVSYGAWILTNAWLDG
jgi:peptide/nickel transport system substrate-binding protein